MRKTACIALALTLVLVAFVPAGAEDVSPFTFDIGLRLLGADIGIGYRGLALLPNVQTTIWTYIGGGYEWLTYYRDAAGALATPGALAAGGSLADKDPSFVRIEGAWRLGIAQGFLWNDRTARNLVEGFLFYRGRLATNRIDVGRLLYDSSLSDRTGLLLNGLQAGIGYDDLLFDGKHKTKSGTFAETSVEWGPGFLANALFGDSDYLRFNANIRHFVPLWDLDPDSARNLLSLFMGAYGAVDYAMGFGAPVPLYVRQTFGGRDQITGLGHAVRGVDSASLDTNLKAVGNLELRANLPALFLADLVPGIVVFWDAGYYAQVGEAGIAAPVPAGFVTSVGGGVSIDLFDLASLAAYVDYRLDAANADGSRLSLLAIEFGMHF